mgnify:CR=1 FL=1
MSSYVFLAVLVGCNVNRTVGATSNLFHDGILIHHVVGSSITFVICVLYTSIQCFLK